MINGNMMAHAGNAIARCVADRRLEYIVDPLTHGFQHNLSYLMNDNNELKSSIAKMVNSYGDLIVEHVIKQKKILSPKSFSDRGKNENFVSCVMSFQRDHAKSTSDSKDYSKYLEYACVPLKPKWLVAPYFCMNADNISEWLDINIQLIQIAMNKFNQDDIIAQIVIEKDLLPRTDYINNMVQRYHATGIKRVFLWLDNYSAFNCDSSLLKDYVGFVSQFSSLGVEVYNIYGGYFSVLMCHPELNIGLKGVCHGLEYGERRPVIPVGGGIPVNKYYFPPLHHRLQYREVSMLLIINSILGTETDTRKRFFEEICSCKTCQEVIGGNINNFSQFGDSKPITISSDGRIKRRFPTTDAKDRCVRHFLNVKLLEWEDVLTPRSFTDIEEELLEASQKYGQFLNHDIAIRFNEWVSVLRTMR